MASIDMAQHTSLIDLFEAVFICSRVAALLHSLQVSSPTPVTAVAWRASTARSQNILLAACGKSIKGFHVSTGKHISTATLPSIEHGDENILSMATSPNGCHVATGGSQGSVQLFDSRGADVQHCLQFGSPLPSSSALASESGHGHTNRVFAMHWHVTDENILFSGGWDNTVQVRSDESTELAASGRARAKAGTYWYAVLFRYAEIAV
jgi:WD40 repeat protein